ncbi:hypothetical protein BDQ17DRAFT_1392458 [Cyathus striatus]|nr:hypothetical protein BDQ17DRAFT_1392458 [Cyathus striatus]
MANKNYLGPVPDELQDLTVVEQSMIAWFPTVQKGLKGYVIIYPQLLNILPPTIDDIITHICVIFIGSSVPSQDWLQNKAKPLIVRKKKVSRALHWLKQNNPLYSDVVIDENQLSTWNTQFVPPFHIQLVDNSKSADCLISKYDNDNNNEVHSSTSDTFESIIVTDTNAIMPAHELRAAALKYFKQKGGSCIQIPHDYIPVNEFNNPSLLPMTYPTLFPYGIGGPEDDRRPVNISFQ